MNDLAFAAERLLRRADEEDAMANRLAADGKRYAANECRTVAIRFRKEAMFFRYEIERRRPVVLTGGDAC